MGWNHQPVLHGLDMSLFIKTKSLSSREPLGWQEFDVISFGLHIYTYRLGLPPTQ